MYFLNKQNRLSDKRAFSLIEIMVAVAIFSVVMLVAVGSLIALIDANRKAQAIKSVMNNLNFAVESMVRNARVGTDFHCESDGTNITTVTSTKDCDSNGVYKAHLP